MWRHLWIPVLIPTLIVKSSCDNNNKTDTVFVRFGHAEVEGGYRDSSSGKAKETVVTTTVGTTTVYVEPSTTKSYEEDTESVVFFPNNEPVVRDDEGYGGAGLRVQDIIAMKTVHDAMDKNFQKEKNDESHNEDIVFVSGKNKDFEKEPENTRKRNNNNQNNYRRNDNTEDLTTAKPKLNCRNLDCNNTINSVCGAKLINKEWRYRLFLNECCFRKVNCGFKYEINRYVQVEIDRCTNKGAHSPERPFYYKPMPEPRPPQVKPEDTRRSSSSRRSMARDQNGQFCSHPCPVTCTDDYDPQCAISGTGQKRVFLNHCKMDQNSCFYGVVWHKNHLSVCVGGKKADMRENRGFIGWMQRVGIVDKKGRLVLQ